MRDAGILIVGYAADRTIAYTVSRLRHYGLQFDVLDIGDYLETGTLIPSTTDPGGLRILLDGKPLPPLDMYSGVYIRTINLYEHRHLPADVRRSLTRKLGVLERIFEALPIRVINRPGHVQSNLSKPFQLLELRRHGFLVPQSYSTNMPDAPGLADRITRGELIYKSNSAVRSIVDLASPGQVGRLSDLINCPVLFQERIIGLDVRVHLVGERTFAQQIRSKAIDYRYPAPFDRVQYRSIEVPSAIGNCCLKFQQWEGLHFTGFDFKIGGDGNWYCLEANPMPGYDGFDERGNHCISDALIDELRGS